MLQNHMGWKHAGILVEVWFVVMPDLWLLLYPPLA